MGEMTKREEQCHTHFIEVTLAIYNLKLSNHFILDQLLCQYVACPPPLLSPPPPFPIPFHQPDPPLHFKVFSSYAMFLCVANH